MGVIDDLLRDIPVPRVFRARQHFDRPVVADPAAACRAGLADAGRPERVRPGMRIAVTAGSRGIANLPAVLKAPVEGLKRAGVDGIVLVNRIKPHVRLRGRFESGPYKMIAIGLGTQRGAEICHQLGFGQMEANNIALAEAAVAGAPILFGVALLENAYHQHGRLELIEAEAIARREPEQPRAATDPFLSPRGERVEAPGGAMGRIDRRGAFDSENAPSRRRDGIVEGELLRCCCSPDRRKRSRFSMPVSPTSARIAMLRSRVSRSSTPRRTARRPRSRGRSAPGSG